MADHVERTIETVLAQISELERQASEHKKTVNGLCQLLSRPPMFPDVDPSSRAPLRDDQFYGKPLATAVQEVLERRNLSGQGAATVAEIYEVLVRGGFHFATKNAENAKRNLYAKLAKNPKFHKLPNGSYGLTEWYPHARKSRDEHAAGSSGTEANGSEANGDDLEEELAEAKMSFDTEPSEAEMAETKRKGK
ncbi:MAG: hypothetical protein L0Y72_08870 [Gemmataceae bacterium]|nr:hypothetical protein [Gemmataceae bacterium]MCI0739142.1 hypothetical protein [Gemmataceae bacterium]